MTRHDVIKNLELFPEFNVDDRWLEQEAMEEVVKVAVHDIKNMQTLEELFEKAKQMYNERSNKPLKAAYGYICPICKGTQVVAEGVWNPYDYCPDCGTRLDWSDED